MKHTLSLVILFAILAVAGPAAAKPTIAILGLEVIDDGSGIDAKATQFAEAMTEALRQRARAGSGPFSLAPGANDKNLIEMKLLSGCDNEATACMAAIGDELAANRLLYGKIEKRPNGYQVSLKLLNVETKTSERSTSEVVPYNEAAGTALSGWGKKLYAKITGASNQGTLVVKANVDRGTVYLDGEAKGTLIGGTLRLTELAAGDYKLMVEAECYLRSESKVSVEGGKDTSEKVTLERNMLGDCKPAGGAVGTGGTGGDTGPGGTGGGGDDRRIITGDISEDGRPGGGARALFWTSTAVAVLGAGAWAYGYSEIKSNEDGCPVGSTKDSEDPECKAGFRGRTITQVGIPVTVVAGAAAAYFFYSGYVKSKKTERPVTARRQGRNVLVAPTVSATTVGGVLQLEF